MHPIVNSSKKLAILLLAWLLLTLGLCTLLAAASGQPLVDSVLLFAPLYLLCLLFIFPNYYVCRGLPLGQTAALPLVSSHVLTLSVTVFLWVLIGRAYANVLATWLTDIDWPALFEDMLLTNIGIVAVQFEVLVLIHYLYFALEKSRDLEQAALQQKLLIAQAELQSLKVSVHPHFLFNALGTLANIALAEPEKAHRFCLLMASFLRYSVAYSKKSSATLAEELEHVQNYLGIERERFGTRLTIEFEIGDGLGQCTVPPLILFPVVENAIKHGIDSRIEGGVLRISAQELNGTLLIEVLNPVDELGRKQKGEGHGLLSVERRLKNRYKEKALMKIRRETGLYSVQLLIPIESETRNWDAQAW
jgi:two-component system, LytTR family, sensor kinase